VKVHIARDSADFGAESGDLIGEHARCGDLDGVVPVIVVVTEGVGEVQDGHLRDLRRVHGDVEMCRLYATLCHGVRHEEEIELAIDDLRLLDEACVNVSTLRRVVDPVLAVGSRCLLEEALTHALVDDDEGDFRRGLCLDIVFTTVLDSDDTVELSKLLVDDLLTHRVADTITVDKDVAGHGAIVEVAVGCEGALEVVR